MDGRRPFERDTPPWEIATCKLPDRFCPGRGSGARGPPCFSGALHANEKKGGFHAKKASGPSGPDHLAEPREIRASDASPAHPTQSPDPVQPCADAPMAGFGCRTAEVPLGSVVYDSGWEDHCGVEVRCVFTAGPSSQFLRDWVRKLVLRPGPSAGGNTDGDS